MTTVHENIDFAFSVIGGGVPLGWVYFVESADSAFIKIGRSKNPKHRLTQLQAASPTRLRLIGAYPAFLDWLEEIGLHMQFKSARVRGEWFRATPGLREYINEYAKEPMQWL